MKKYLILGAAVVVVGLLINYSLGGFVSIKPQIIPVEGYIIYGTSFEGNYKSDELNGLVEKIRKLQQKIGYNSEVVIVNYLNETNEKIGEVKNFVGIRTTSRHKGLLEHGLEERIISAKRTVRFDIEIKPLVMPSPEKTKKIAFELAEKEGVELQNLSIEQYLESGILRVEFPIKEPKSFIEQMGDVYGIESFNESRTWHYTFNVKKGDLQIARAWSWTPVSGDVTLVEKGDTIHYNHNNITDEWKQTDHKFINDKYWLLFPFHLVWDTGYKHELEEDVEAPISGQLLSKLTIQYNNANGYTPGDAYDFYIDKNFEIKEWVFRKGGQKEPTNTTTWEAYQVIEGIKVASDHYSKDGNFRLWFTNINIE